MSISSHRHIMHVKPMVTIGIQQSISPTYHSAILAELLSAICRSAIRLGVFAYLLFLLSSGVDGYFEGQALPDQLTARNITITLRTVVRGLSYLLTFLFAANTVGLAGESPIQALHLLQEG